MFQWADHDTIEARQQVKFPPRIRTEDDHFW